MTVELFSTRFVFRFSFFAVLTVMLITCDNRIALITVVSSLLHECGHLAFMYAFGEAPQSVCFGCFGIRIDRKGESKLSYGRLALIAAGGVIVNIFLLAVFVGLYLCTGFEVFAVGLAVNVLIAGLNMMPIGILDAGRFLRYILLVHFDEEKTDGVLRWVSDFTVFAFALFSVAYTVFVKINFSLICVCVYLTAMNVVFNDRD